jgi:hypothetical protein
VIVGLWVRRGAEPAHTPRHERSPRSHRSRVYLGRDSVRHPLGPTMCIRPALRCPNGFASDCVQDPTYCNHQYVPLRIAIALTGVLIAFLVLAVSRRRAVEQPDSASAVES